MPDLNVKDTPSNRAPGPDGFTAAFYKAAWPIIKADVMNAFNALWSLDARSLHLINDALMVLLRKNNALAALKDYRPISLMHSFGKLFAKCLTRRLAPRLPDMVVRNQSAFIKGRSIHDNFRAVQLACRCLHNKRFASVLLKIDIAKAFDSVAWPFLIEVMQHIGFPRRWSNWISMILSTASTKVLLNRRPGMRIIHARGVRQGDPISPMLFVITMEALNALIRREDMHRTLTPLPAPVTGHRASLYADDLVVLIAPLVDDLSCLRQILLLFAGASGLVTNEDKCVATPIRCTDEMINNVQHVFPCAVVPFPCKYLGIPLTLGRLRRADEQALVDTIAARIPTWKSGLLSVDTRREGPADEGDSICYPYAPQHCVISSWGIQQIDKRRRAFLWSGTESVTGGKCHSCAGPRTLAGWECWISASSDSRSVCSGNGSSGSIRRVGGQRYRHERRSLSRQWRRRACRSSAVMAVRPGCGPTTGRQLGDYVPSLQISTAHCPSGGGSAR